MILRAPKAPHCRALGDVDGLEWRSLVFKPAWLLRKRILANNSFFALAIPQTLVTLSTFTYSRGKQIFSISGIPDEPWRKGKVSMS